MDIAKIRKKAREKEKQAAQEPQEASEGRGSGSSEATAEETAAVPQGPGVVQESAGEDLEEEGEPLPKAPATQETAVVSEETREEPLGPEEESAEAAGNVLELLAFNIAEKEFAFRIDDVEEIIPYQGITSVPLVPDYVSGVMSLRGKIIPVIDLKSRFALGQTVRHSAAPAGQDPDGRKEKILILSGPKGLIGATVDKIKGVLRFPEDSMLAPPAHLSEEERKFIDGVVILDKRFISIVRFGDAMNIEVG